MMINSFFSGFINTRKGVIFGFNKNKLPYKRAQLFNGQHVYVPISKQNIDIYAYVLIQINKVELKNDESKYYGAIIKVYGSIDDLNAYRKALIDFVTYGWGKPIEPINYIDNSISRVDFTKHLTISIDPPGCYDIDDAFDITKQEYGFELNIHIADVSSYVLHGTKLDVELNKRVSSLYFNSEQINMLPLDLVHQCSLLQDETRRSFTMRVKLDNNYKIIDYKFVKGTIINKHAIDYDTGNKVLEKHQENIEYYQTLFMISHFCCMYKYNEYCILDTHEIIEILMIFINNHVAKTIHSLQPTHVPLRHCKLTNNVNYNTENINHISIYNKICTFGQEAAEYSIGWTEITKEEKRHNILDLDLYTHFSSPIRRYFDIYVHRVLWDILNDSKYIHKINTDYINTKCKEYKNIVLREHQINILEQIQYNIDSLKNKTSNDAFYTTNAYIIGVEDNMVYLYFPEFDISYYSKLFSKKLLYFKTEQKHIEKQTENQTENQTESINTISYQMKHDDHLSQEKKILNMQTGVISKINIGTLIICWLYVDLLAPKNKLICKTNLLIDKPINPSPTGLLVYSR